MDIIPTTVESFIFELIETYKDEKFKQVLAIAKDRFKETEGQDKVMKNFKIWIERQNYNDFDKKYGS